MKLRSSESTFLAALLYDSLNGRRKDLRTMETLSMDDALKRGKTIANSSMRMTWKLQPPSILQQILSYTIPFVFSRDPKIMWARSYDAYEGLTIYQLCMRFDTDQVSPLP
jgi:hypothetical protein